MRHLRGYVLKVLRLWNIWLLLVVLAVAERAVAAAALADFAQVQVWLLYRELLTQLQWEVAVQAAVQLQVGQAE